MTGMGRMSDRQEADPDTFIVRIIKMVMMMMNIVRKKQMAVVSFTTLEGTEDDTSQENILSVILARKAQETPGMTPSLLGSSCSLSSYSSWSPFLPHYLKQTHSIPSTPHLSMPHI